MRLEFGWYNRQGELIGRDSYEVPDGAAFVQQVVYLDGVDDNAAISTIMGAPRPSEDSPASIFGLSVETDIGQRVMTAYMRRGSYKDAARELIKARDEEYLNRLYPPGNPL